MKLACLERGIGNLRQPFTLKELSSRALVTYNINAPRRRFYHRPSTCSAGVEITSDIASMLVGRGGLLFSGRSLQVPRSPTTTATASTTSSPKRALFSTEPPYSSVRPFESSLKN